MFPTRGLGYNVTRGETPCPHYILESSMYRTFKTLPWLGAACALALTLACNSTPNAPTAPEGATSTLGAAADGSTLKANAPALVGPMNDERLTTRQPTLVTNNTQGQYVNRPFAYEFQVMNDGGSVIRSATVAAGSGTTSWLYPENLDRDTPYRWRVRATLGGMVGPWSPTARFLTVRENRTPSPATGRLPLPNRLDVVNRVIAQNPGILAANRSCQDPSHGGNAVTGWEFLDKLVDELRLTDTRWGYNGKRGNVNDPSHDVVAYNYGRQPDEGTTEVYIVDVLLSHCGPGPSAAWIDQTEITFLSNTIGRWTSRGRFPSSQGIQ
jgi:hypothetical protein